MTTDSEPTEAIAQPKSGKRCGNALPSRKATDGVLLATLTNSSPLPGDRLGGAVAAVGDKVLVGAYGHADYMGAAYLFDFSRLNCPGDILATTTPGSGGVEVNFALPDPPPLNTNATNISCVPASGSLFPVGVTPVVCTATDNMGFTNICTFNVTVQEVASEPHDLAVVRIRAPRFITLTASRPVVTRRVVVSIQNRSAHTETLVNTAQLSSLVGRASQTCEPINPAPPVTRNLIRAARYQASTSAQTKTPRSALP